MTEQTPVYTVAGYDAEEGGYWAEVLDLPGCVAQGETLDQLKVAVTEAIAAYEETRAELGGKPEPRRAAPRLHLVAARRAPGALSLRRSDCVDS